MQTIDRSKVVAAIEALGLPAGDVVSIQLTSDRVMVVLFEHDADGRRYLRDRQYAKRAETFDVAPGYPVSTLACACAVPVGQPCQCPVWSEQEAGR